MKPSIKIKNSTLDFPIYENSDYSLRNKISQIGNKIGFGKTEITKKGIKIIRGLNNISLEMNEREKIGILGPKIQSYKYRVTKSKETATNRVKCCLQVCKG